jgi:hypothetical protein
MIDVFEHWKNQKFVIPKNIEGYDCTVVLSDIAYWNTHHEELYNWCDNYNCKIIGMTVDVPDSRTLTLFCLRWS